MKVDWASYRETCDRGDVLSRYLLTGTIDLLAAAEEAMLAQRLQHILGEDPLTKPLGHRAGSAADFFVLKLELASARRILEVVRAARGAGQRTAAGRSLGGFAEAWQEYLDWQTGVHPRSPGAKAGG